MSFVVHKSVLPPTGADACVSCFFTPSSNSNNTNDFKEAFENDENDDENVIVASGNRLTIYSVKRRRRKEREEEYDEEEKEENEDDEIVVRLEVISEFDVNGTISDLCVLKHPKRFLMETNTTTTNNNNTNVSSKKGTKTRYLDGLLITIRESKAVCVCWDPETRKCVSTSLHFWEDFAGDEGSGAATTSIDGTSSGLRIGNVPIIGRADPEGRCAAVLLRNEEKAKVKIMPASETSTSSNYIKESSNGSKKMTTKKEGEGTVYVPATMGSSFDLDVRKILGPSAAFVRDCCFLHGYGEPVLMIL